MKPIELQVVWENIDYCNCQTICYGLLALLHNLTRTNLFHIRSHVLMESQYSEK